MTRDILVQFAAIVFTTTCLTFVTYVIGSILFSKAMRQETPESLEAFWDKLESRGAIYTQQEAEALYTLYQEHRGMVISSIDRKENSV